MVVAMNAKGAGQVSLMPGIHIALEVYVSPTSLEAIA